MSCKTAPLNKQAPPPQTRLEWKALINWPVKCDEGVNHIRSARFIGVDYYQLESGMELVSVLCETGLYNQGRMVFLKDIHHKNKYMMLSFPQFAEINDAQMLQRTENVNTDPSDVKLDSQYYQFTDTLIWGNRHTNMDNNKITFSRYFRGGRLWC